MQKRLSKKARFFNNINFTADDEADLAIFASNWLATVSPEPQTAPEPHLAE